jgi:hypothetical protein
LGYYFRKGARSDVMVESFERGLHRQLWRARILAFLLTTPVLVGVCLLAVWGLYDLGYTADAREFLPASVFFFSLPGLIVGTFLYYVIFRAARIALTLPLALLVWLRKFDHETRGSFKLSSMVDVLGRWGVCSITLEDAAFSRSRGRSARRRLAILWTVGDTSRRSWEKS